MKRIALALLACSALSAQELDLSDVAKQLSAEFRKKNVMLDFRRTLAVARFKTTSARLEKNVTAALVRASFEKEFVRSLYFEVVERDNLDKIIAEIEIRQKGLVQTKPNEDILKGADYLLVGELAEDGNSLIVSAKLVQASTGAVVAAAQSRTPLEGSERAADAFRYSAFQSPYGITLGADGTIVRPSGETKNMPGWLSIFVAYRVAKPLRIGAGISNLFWNEYVREETAGTGGGGTNHRNYSLSGLGPRLFVDLLWPVHPRLNLGMRGDVVFMSGMKLEQDISNASTWDFDATTGAPTKINQRVTVNAYSNEGMTIFKPAVLAEFLISSRLSFYASFGYMLSTVFKPFIYEANGERHWAQSADINGTFARYGNFNFARRPDGRPVEFQLGLIFFDIGLSLHF